MKYSLSKRKGKFGALKITADDFSDACDLGEFACVLRMAHKNFKLEKPAPLDVGLNLLCDIEDLFELSLGSGRDHGCES